MMLTIALGGAKYIFRWAQDGDPPPEPSGSPLTEFAEVPFGSPQQAIAFVRKFGGLFEFQRLLRERFSTEFSRWQQDDILKRLADALVRGHLKVIKRWEPAGGPSVSEVTPVPRRAPQPVASSSSPESTFPPNHDGAAQADALRAAAAEGIPFCEECERPRQTPAA